jgi:carbonic anhydrase/acetyltransferase-like protein (isoleucine patch superfamily)
MIIPYKDIMPKIDPSVFVADNAYIIGDVEIGEYSSIWFNTIIRGDENYIRIGKRTNIQDFSMVHITRNKYPTILEDDITVGHGVILHGCVVKSRCLIGIGAIILDGAVIEEESIVGAGALVTERMVIPKRSLVVGTPAKVKRELSDKDISMILGSVNNYIEYAKNYKK